MSNKRTQGFTLIELLVGIGIFSVIGAGLALTFASGISVHRRMVQTQRSASDVFTPLKIIARDLENAVAYDLSKTCGNQGFRAAFKGEAQHLSLLVPSEDGLQRVEYVLREPGQGRRTAVFLGTQHKKNIIVTERKSLGQKKFQLIRRESPFLRSAQGNDIEEEILAEDILPQAFRFLFARGSKHPEKNLIWGKDWPYPFLPRGVRIEIRLACEGLAVPSNLHRDVFIPAGRWGEE